MRWMTLLLLWALASMVSSDAEAADQAGGSKAEDVPWWKTATLYQIYPRSFKDSNGDGVGDLKGIKLLLDLVPNHTSDEHEWFQKSIQKIEPYTDFYVWQDGEKNATTGKMDPPNNWISVFSGSAWEWNEKRQQFYLHQFVKKQPDLNYSNPAVVKAMDDIITFWLDKGVDGFRVDAVPFLVEAEGLPDEPAQPGTLGENYNDLQHFYTQNQPQISELMRHWAELVNNYSQADGRPRVLFAEVYADVSTTVKYYGTGNSSLLQPFNFQLFVKGGQSTRAPQMREIILSWMDAMPKDAAANWVMGNHDQSRAANRYGPDMVDAMNLLTGVLPGIKIVYNGEEIGMQNTYIRWDQTVDPSGVLLGPDHYRQGSRDPERTPMQWDHTSGAGFSKNRTTWLPVNPNYWWLNVAAQETAQFSHLKVFKEMIKVRQDPVLEKGDLSVLAPNNDTLVVVRKYNGSTYMLIVNMGNEFAEYTTKNLFGPQGLDMHWTAEICCINSDLKRGMSLKKGSARLNLGPKAAVLLKSS